MNLGERIKKLRKEGLNLTQQKLADKIHQTRNTVARYEMGILTPSATVITLICREFHVNEEWLREGEGEMFAPAPEDDLSAYLMERGMGKAAQTFIKAYFKLPQEKQKAVDAYLDSVLAEEKAERAEQEQAAEMPQTMHTVEMTEEEYRDFMLDRTKKECGTATAG